MIPEAEALYRPFIDALILLAFVILATRLVGLRSFSKMSGFDFAITVATGSVVASVVVGKQTPFLTGFAAIAALFIVQIAVARLRVASDAFSTLVDNEPLLLMDGETILDDNLRAAKVTRDDLIAKLREANVLDYSQVRAVVMETTGDVSVLHGSADGPPLAEAMLKGVRRTP